MRCQEDKRSKLYIGRTFCRGPLEKVRSGLSISGTNKKIVDILGYLWRNNPSEIKKMSAFTGPDDNNMRDCPYREELG